MKRGFTLIELLIVVMIIAVLAGVAMPQYRRAVRKAEAAEAEAMLRTLYDSSERLVASFGYRSYADLYNAGKGQLSRMDMFGASNTPAHCTLQDYTMNCNKFNYNIHPFNNSRYITAKLNTSQDDVKGITLVFDRNTQSVYCQNPSRNDTACDIYGFDSFGGGGGGDY